jgi:D-glycero-alpha-D-manno-heptose-7-phosphate kinase
MVISKTPLRISFAGGGTDLPAFYRRFGGAVLSTTIDKYIYVTVNRKFDNGIRVSYSKTENVDHVEQIEHRIVRACLMESGITGGVEITSIADIPSKGTGLGSSSSFAVGLLHALSAYRGVYCSSGHLAREASRIEIELLGNQIGKQDQYAAAYGGLNLIRFNGDDSVVVEPVVCGREIMHGLESRLMVFYTGITRSAPDILREQSAATESQAGTQARLRRISDLAFTLREELMRGNLDAMGEILHESWCLKREVARGITSEQIDAWYAAARAAGALGGKLLGAGGGGFLAFYVPPERREPVSAALPDLRLYPMSFEQEGSRIVFYTP